MGENTTTRAYVVDAKSANISASTQRTIGIARRISDLTITKNGAASLQRHREKANEPERTLPQ
jgi:hypothetical protein